MWRYCKQYLLEILIAVTIAAAAFVGRAYAQLAVQEQRIDSLEGSIAQLRQENREDHKAILERLR
jgi:Tfp pilus assembly protein PilN